MVRPLFTLTTDFGSSHYVGQMKGVLIGAVPDCHIFDITHDVPPQNIPYGAMVLADSISAFPEGTIHIAVVDPGVGTARALIAMRIGHWFLLGPDNGLLSTVAHSWPVVECVTLDRDEHWTRSPSNTFHGRDILAPVAAKIAQGVPLGMLGSTRPALHPNLIPPPSKRDRSVRGDGVLIDHFGNIVTNIHRDDLVGFSGVPTVLVNENATQEVRWVETYGDTEPGVLVALLGSSGRVEISVVNGNASKLFSGGTPSVELCW